MSTQQIQIKTKASPTRSQPGEFSPRAVTANAGDNLTWFNQDSQDHWPAPSAAQKTGWLPYQIPAGSESRGDLALGPNAAYVATATNANPVVFTTRGSAPATGVTVKLSYSPPSPHLHQHLPGRQLPTESHLSRPTWGRTLVPSRWTHRPWPAGGADYHFEARALHAGLCVRSTSRGNGNDHCEPATVVIKERSMLEDNETPCAQTGDTRREFLGRVVAAGAGLALSVGLPYGGTTVEAQSAPTPGAPGEKLVSIAEIKKTAPGGPVQGVIKILNENKAYPVDRRLADRRFPTLGRCAISQAPYRTVLRYGRPRMAIPRRVLHCAPVLATRWKLF